MLVATLHVKFLILDSGSLKAKRAVLKSVKERLRNKFNISVAEVGNYDQLILAEIGIVTVGTENRHLDETMQKVVNFLENDHRIELVNVLRDIY